MKTERLSTPEGAKELQALCERLVEQAKAEGATDAEAFATYSRSATASLEQNDVKGAEVSELSAVGMRVLVGDKMGFAYVNRFDDDALAEALADALTVAKAAPGDPANVLPDPEPLGDIPGLWDDALVSTGPDEAVARAVEMLRAARGVDERVSVDTGSFSFNVEHEAIASSKGVSASASGTSVVYGLFGMAVDGEEVGSFDHVYDGHLSLDAIAHEELGRRFGRKVVDLLGPRETRPYRGPVLFSAEAFEEIFVDTLLDAVDGDRVVKGKSRLKEKLGEKVASGSFTLVDDGTMPGGLRSSPFDREGLPHRRTPIVEGGVLRTFLYDTKSARRAGARSTGHAQGSARSLPGVGPTNVRVKAGDLSHDELLRRLDEGLYVGRFSGSTDSVSGDFSGVAKGSFWVEGGERQGPVKETLIAGNVFTLLLQIVALGKELHRDMAYEGPWVLVEGVDVSSGAP